MNCCVVPKTNDGSTGVTTIETSAAGVTFSVVDPLMEPLAAITVVLPELTLFAKPPAPIVAMPGFVVLQVAVAVKS